MGQSISIMNTKGGVGKSTTVMALAETLSVYHGKTVLVVDSDSQTSISTMLMPVARWEALERQSRTLVDFLTAGVLAGAPRDWRQFVATGVSDVDDAKTIFLMPSHMELSLFERAVSSERKEPELRATIRTFLEDAKRLFDIVLIDCPPGLSVVTECWVREADHFLPPTKPDYLSARGLNILRSFRERFADQGFANLIGVLINMKDPLSEADEQWHRRLAADPQNRVFQTAIPRRTYLQHSADFDAGKRTYMAKYPGDAGRSLRLVTEELISRLAGEAWVKPEAKPEPRRAEPPAPVIRREAAVVPQPSPPDDDHPLDLTDAELADVAPARRLDEMQPLPQAGHLAADDEEPIQLAAVAGPPSAPALAPPEPEDEPLILPAAEPRRIATISPLAPVLRSEPSRGAHPSAQPAPRPQPVLPSALPIRRIGAGAGHTTGQGIRRLVRPGLPVAADLREPPSLAAAPQQLDADEEPIALPAIKAGPPVSPGE